VTRDDLSLPQLAAGSVITVGTFDGVHLGHRDILRCVAQRAAALGVPGLLVTFRPHPLDVVNPTAAPMLLTPGEEQLDALADSGPLLVSVLPFTPSLASYSAEAFVSEILADPQTASITEAIITMAHVLGLRVVAEGVEQAGEVELLKRWRCDVIQGYYYSSAVTAERFAELLAAGTLRGEPYQQRASP